VKEYNTDGRVEGREVGELNSTERRGFSLLHHNSPSLPLSLSIYFLLKKVVILLAELLVALLRLDEVLAGVLLLLLFDDVPS
jgi:hypothetical protein